LVPIKGLQLGPGPVITSSAGGWSPEKGATEQVQKIADAVAPQLEEKLRRRFGVYMALKYREQVVAGTNYLICVRVDYTVKGCVHIEVYQTLPSEGSKVILVAAEDGKTELDHLEPMDQKTQSKEQIVGGWSDEKVPRMQQVGDSIKPQLESKFKATYPYYKVCKYRQTVTSGLEYLLKIQHGVGEKDYIHALVWEDVLVMGVPTPTLIEAKDGMTADAPLDPQILSS